MSDRSNHRLTADEVTVGDTGPTVEIEDVSRRDIVRYAGASGDFNPIHYDTPYARAAGNETVFAQGMLTAGYAAHMVTAWFGPEAIRRFESRFKARLFPGETVVVDGEVIGVTHYDDGTAVVAEFEAATNDETLLTGKVEAILPSSP